MTFSDALRKLPPSTNAWTCRWFYLTCYLSVVLVALGLTVIPGALGIAAIVLGVVCLMAVLSMRQTGICETK